MKRLALFVAALPLLLGGCGFLHGGITHTDPFQSRAERRLAVRVQNVNAEAMSVRVLGRGSRYEIGRVPAGSVQQYVVPWPRDQEVRFQIQPMAGRSYTTNGVQVRPGDRVELIITQPLQRSTVRR